MHSALGQRVTLRPLKRVASAPTGSLAALPGNREE